MTECHGNGVGRVDYGCWEDEEVRHVGEKVGEYDEGKGGVDYAGEVARWVYELASYVVDLLVQDQLVVA